MADVFKRHDHVRALFDNLWLPLFALNENGQMSWHCDGGLAWSEVSDGTVHRVMKVAV